MSSEQFPRWSDASSDASPELRRALLELSNERVDSERLERLETRFAGVFGSAFGPVEPGAPPEAPASGSPQALASVSSAAGLAAKISALVVVSGAILWGASKLAARSDVETPRAPDRVMAAHTAVQPIPSVDVSEPPSGTSAMAPANEPPAVAAQAPRQRRVEKAVPLASSAPTGSVSEEARLLRAARADSKGSPDRALALLAEHERRFPRGTLVEEREIFAIELLLRQGKRDEATERASELRARSPGSPYVGIAERMLSKP